MIRQFLIPLTPVYISDPLSAIVSPSFSHERDLVSPELVDGSAVFGNMGEV